ncbi:hypothetical protein FQN60_013051 [Etheostoma spectabile]|uniref:Uncharacterized protein n=1 Tax=Etheostoma spectabile TaxID=54343 RepID=A0A5J5DAN5_9PERO|nr:hypothetical protein FQN60_013051 [Etheostoma spectabile]
MGVTAQSNRSRLSVVLPRECGLSHSVISPAPWKSEQQQPFAQQHFPQFPVYVWGCCPTALFLNKETTG